MKLKGLVIKSMGSSSIVQAGDKEYSCVVRGKFRLKNFDLTNPVAVGDIVEFEWNDGDESGVIKKIEKRKNYIIRKSATHTKKAQLIATNVDMAYLIVTPAMPRTSTGFIDRFLVTAEAYSIPVTLIFNKSDIDEGELEKYRNDMIRLYTEIGYDCILLSALTGDNIDALKKRLKGKVNLFAGHSGVGKSTLINRLEEIDIKTDEISEMYQKGKHTTTFAEMYELKEGGYLIDTPGLKEFGLYEISKEELSHYFPEMLEVLPNCKFNNCMHIHEIKCAVKEAVEERKIHPVRYESYLKMLEEDTWR